MSSIFGNNQENEKQHGLWQRPASLILDIFIAKSVNLIIFDEVIDRPGVWGQESVLDVPDWAKQNGCWWEADLISDEEFVNVILYLIDQGIIIVI